MDCLEFENELQTELDERRDPNTPRLRAHAAECAPCRRSLTDAMLVLSGVFAWRKTLPSINLVDQIDYAQHPLIQRLQANDSPGSNLIRRAPGSWSEATFARALIAVSAAALCFMFWSANSPSESTQIANRALVRARQLNSNQLSHSNSFQAEPNLVTTDLKMVLASAEGAYSHLAQESVAVAHDFALLVPPGGLFRSMNTSDSGVPPSSEKVQGLLPANVYPVGDSVESALQLLLQAVPGVEKSS